MKQRELECLIQDFLDGSLADENLKVLQTQLRSNPVARDLYRDYVYLQSALQQQASVPRGIIQPVIPVERVILRQKHRTLRRAAFSAAALVIIGLVSMALLMVKKAPSSLAFEIAPGSRFTITHISPEGQSAESMTMLKGSRLKLEQGTVALTFDTGVKSIIIGPADLTLLGKNQLSLIQGIGWFDVPEGAEGFQVTTEGLEIIDLGTEFGVIAQPDELGAYDQVHVLKGKVHVISLANTAEYTPLVAGQSCRLSTAETLDITAANPSLFLTQLPQSLLYLHWSFDFSENNYFPAKGASVKVPSAKAAPRSAGISSLVTEGKFGKAVAIQHFEQELITTISGVDGNKPRTIACWVKINRPPSSPLIRHSIVGWGARDIDMLTNQRWQLAVTGDGNAGSTLCIVGAGLHRGSTPLNDNQWHHIACVWNPSKYPGAQGELTAYIDGKREPFRVSNSSVNADTDTTRDATSLVIGATMIPERGEYATLKGCIDELFIIEGALTAQEISRLMETNLVE